MSNNTNLDFVKNRWVTIRSQLENGYDLEDIYLDGKYKDLMDSMDFKGYCYGEYLLDKEFPNRHTNTEITNIHKHKSSFEFTDKDSQTNNKPLKVIAILVLSVLALIAIISAIL